MCPALWIPAYAGIYRVAAGSVIADLIRNPEGRHGRPSYWLQGSIHRAGNLHGWLWIDMDDGGSVIPASITVIPA